eukprot:gene17412-20722_t
MLSGRSVLLGSRAKGDAAGLSEEVQELLSFAAARLSTLNPFQQKHVEMLTLLYDADSVVPALSDSLVKGRFDPRKAVSFRDPEAIQMLLDPCLLLRLPVGTQSALVYSFSQLALSSATNVQMCREAGVLQRGLHLLRVLLSGLWPEVSGGETAGTSLKAALMQLLQDVTAYSM